MRSQLPALQDGISNSAGLHMVLECLWLAHCLSFHYSMSSDLRMSSHLCASLPTPLALPGADCLAKGAKALEDHDLEKALVMAEEALEIYKSEDKAQDALDVFRCV